MQTTFKLQFVCHPQHTFHYTDAPDEVCSVNYSHYVLRITGKNIACWPNTDYFVDKLSQIQFRITNLLDIQTLCRL